MNCEFCQSPVHIWFDCPKKPDGWRPARLAKQIPGSLPVAAAESNAERTGREPRARPAVTAGETAQKSTGRINPASIKKDGSPRKNARYLLNCICEACGSAFEAVPNEVKRGKARTCSKPCAAKLAAKPDMYGPNNPNWKGGISANGKTARYEAKYPEKHAAHRAMTEAIRRKELIRQTCEVCGEAKTDGHHDDYSKPLDVRWLCRKHHIEAHNGRFGTQALPVDTNSLPTPKANVFTLGIDVGAGGETNPDQPMVALAVTDQGLAFTPSAGTGEHTDRQHKFDKVAYQRDYMRKWRADRGNPA